ncbi:MAG TPA: SMC-Scp complex subunit ScpB [Bacteroidota bacterium]|nr:SMC-Scp complex subunit ScpB [Bacteroidota bacterium]
MEEQQTTTAPVLLEIPSALKQLIEGLVFASDEPLSVGQIKAIYEEQTPDGQERHIEQAEIQQIIRELNAEYQSKGKAYRIVAIAGGFQFATMKEYAEWIGRLYKEQARRKLSQSSLETLAIVAYKQPISKPEIESIRGVNCDYVMKTLLEKDLVTITGRADTVGRPLLYGTTREFLRHFGLNEVTDLPRPREIEEILGESQFETERRMLEAQAGADQMKKEEDDFKSRLPHIPKKKSEMDETVQIIPRRKTAKINLRETEGQNAIPFADREPEKTSEPVASDEPQAEPAVAAEPEGGGIVPDMKFSIRETVTEEKADEPVEELEQPAIEKAPEIQDEIEVEKVEEAPVEAVQMEVKEAPPEVPLANIEQSTDVEKEDVLVIPPQKPDPEPEMSQPRRTRWTVWKEKVQTFIKKLFG